MTAHRLATLIVLLFVGVQASAADAPKRPNILFVLIDDMGYRDLGCFGGTRAATPDVKARLTAELIAWDKSFQE